MPQLDKVHFLSQYFWLCVFYFGFYFLVSKHFLPRMARILQFRKSKLNHTQQDGADKELSLVKESGNTALENVFSLSHKFWSHNTQRMDEWYGDKLYSLNNNYLQECNKLYIKSVGDYSLSQNSVLGGIELARPSPCYTWFFTHKLKQPLDPKKVTSYAMETNQALEAGSHAESKPTTKKGRADKRNQLQPAAGARQGNAQQGQSNLAKADSSAKKGKQKKDGATSHQPSAATLESNNHKKAKPPKL